MTKEATPIQKWLMGKYAVWQVAQGGPQSELAFAKYVGVSQAAMNNWMNGERTPTGLYVERLANKLGYDIYDVLGLARPATEVSKWLREKYDEWQADFESKTVEKGTVGFAAYCGIEFGKMDLYLRSVSRPQGKDVDLLAAKLGPEVYDLLGLQRPDPHVTRMVNWFTSLSGDAQKKAEELMQQLAEGKQLATPEGVTVRGHAAPAQSTGAVDKRAKLLALLESKSDEELEQLVEQIEKSKARRKKVPA